jgi:rare lipoprotein A
MRLTIALTLLLATAPARPAFARHHRAQIGVASYYAADFQGHRTASGKKFDEWKLTAAHPTLPMGARVRVTNLDNGKHIVLTVIDRGPYRRDRIIDVSRRAARVRGVERNGTARVKVEVLHT